MDRNRRGAAGIKDKKDKKGRSHIRVWINNTKRIKTATPMKRKQQHTTKEKIIKLIIECVIVLAFVALLRNDCVEAAMDNVVLLENRRPGYFKWLSSRAVSEDTEDGSVTVYPVSKLYLPEITTDDLSFLKKYTKNTGRERNLIYFLDGTGYDVEKGVYGSVQNWTGLWLMGRKKN